LLPGPQDFVLILVRSFLKYNLQKGPVQKKKGDWSETKRSRQNSSPKGYRNRDRRKTRSNTARVISTLAGHVTSKKKKKAGLGNCRALWKEWNNKEGEKRVIEAFSTAERCFQGRGLLKPGQLETREKLGSPSLVLLASYVTGGVSRNRKAVSTGLWTEWKLRFVAEASRRD